MIRYLIRRVIQAIVIVFGVTLIVFILSKFIPGGPAAAALGPKRTAIQVDNFNRVNHYNVSVFQQYWIYIRDLVVNQNLGYSYKRNEGVTSAIQDALPKTLILVGLSTLFAVIIAIPLGVLQVIRRNKPIDYTLTGGSFILYAMPSFLLGQLLILYFAIDLGWFPVAAPNTDSTKAILEDPRALVLPVITLSAITIAAFSRYMRSSMMEAMTQDYIRTARAKGAGSRRVLFRHALRNALIPIITLLGLALPAIVGGAVITETVFNYPGMGLLTTQAAENTDIPLLLGTTFVAALATVIGSLLADVFYAVADPRVRYG
jgi:peptide/nickel transport system permease protein